MQSSENRRCVERFESTYRKPPQEIAFCPYRICPIGAHIDHQHGKITGLAIDKGIFLAYGPKQNGVMELSSTNFEKRAQFHIPSVPEQNQGDWADHIRGAVAILSRKHTLHTGLCGVIEGTLPIGGLSSSAAVIIAFLSALCKVNGIRLSKQEMIQTAMAAENKYVGVACGKLDQSCEIYSRKDHLLYLDTRDDSYELLPQSPFMRPYKIAVFSSGIERTNIGSKYNIRVDECKSAAYALLAYAGIECGRYEDALLRDVPYELYQHYQDKLPENWRRRAEHFYTESRRVEKGAEAWRRGDIAEFGRLSFESGKSSIRNYETGSPELKSLYKIMLDTEGIYGGRFSGAGFKGCCMALIDPAYEERIIQGVGRAYIREFPALKERYSAHICSSADGIVL